VTFADAAAVLVALGILAAWMPARCAARLDPETVLRRVGTGSRISLGSLSTERCQRVSDASWPRVNPFESQSPVAAPLALAAAGNLAGECLPASNWTINQRQEHEHSGHSSSPPHLGARGLRPAPMTEMDAGNPANVAALPDGIRTEQKGESENG
jgi:hypothetical protein